MSTQKKQSIIEGGLILTLALIVIKLLGWFYRVQLIAIIDENGNSYYTTAYNLYILVYSVTVMGFPVAVSKIISGYIAEGRYLDVKKVISISTRFFALVGVVGTAIIFVIAGPYTSTIVDRPLAFWGVIAVAPSIFFCCVMSVYRGYNQGFSNMTPTAVSQVIEVLIKVVCGLAGAAIVRNILTNEYNLSGTVAGVVISDAKEMYVQILALSAAGAMLGITLSTIAAYLYLVARHRIKGDGITKLQLSESPAPHNNKAILKRIIWIALPIALSAATAAFAALIDDITISHNLRSLFENHMDTVLASHGGLLKNAVETIPFDELSSYLYGIYAMELVICNLITTITGSFGMSALPLVSSSWTAGDQTETRKNINTSLRITMLIAAPAGFGIAFLAQPISSFVYSGKPTGALIGAPMLQLLGFAGIIIALVGIVNALLQGVGKPWVALWLMTIGLVIKCVSNYIVIAIPEYNIKAAPVGNILCYSFIAIAGLIILRRYTKLKIDLIGTIAKPMFAGLITGVFARLGYNIIYKYLASNTVSTMGAIILAVVIYVIFLGILKAIERDDILSMPGGKKVAKILEKLHIIR